MNKEDFFISEISKETQKLIGDDGVLVDGFIYSQDAFFEDVHFKREWMSLDEIAYKSMIVNISDAIVMNSIPKYALLTVAIPKIYTKSELSLLAEGFKKAAKEFGIKIIGGDTISNDKLDISITIISKPNKKTIYRKGLKKGDYIAYTGSLGDSLRELKEALRFKKFKKNSKLISPKLKPSFFYNVAKYLKIGMDISDGLFFELQRVSRLNRVGFKFFKKIDKKIGCSGEEYEFLIGFDKRYLMKIKNIAKKEKIKITLVAKAIRGSFKNYCKAHHF